MSSVDNLCKQFEPRLGPTGSKLFDTLIIYLNNLNRKTTTKQTDLEKNQQMTKHDKVHGRHTSQWIYKQELRQRRNTRPFAKTVGVSLSNLERRNIHSCAQHIVLTEF